MIRDNGETGSKCRVERAQGLCPLREMGSDVSRVRFAQDVGEDSAVYILMNLDIARSYVG